MALWAMWAVVAAAADPAVAVTWRGDDAHVRVDAPPGHELATDAPASLELALAGRTVAIHGDGGALATVPLGPVRGTSVTGSLSVTVCAKADGTCVPRSLAVTGDVPDTRRGELALRVTTPAAPHVEAADPFQADAAAAAKAAFADATAAGDRVLLDFSAVWCPPCNLLAAEVLHADPLPDGLDGWHVVVLDVDDPSSFALKDRYGIGGYPTVVATEADGTEIARISGYPGRGAFLDWLADAGSDLAPADVTPADAARRAWALVRRNADDDDVRRWLTRAEQGEPTREGVLARMNLAPTAGDARWLATNAPGTAADWVYPALGLLDDDPDLHGVLVDAVHADLPSATGSRAADLAYFAARLAGDDGAPWYAAAAATLRTSLTGDPEHDRGHYTWLATLWAKSGDVDGATAFLREQADRWPDEPTWHLTAGRLLLEAERPADALAWTTEGLERSWGDNHLRVAALHARALVALDRADDAAAAARTALDAAAPADDLSVRTHRYRDALREFLE